MYTVPPNRRFLDVLAHAVLAGTFGAPADAGDPLALADITILLPTRRAARALQDAFLAASGGGAVILPRIRPISEGDEDLTLLTGLAAAATTTGIIGAGLDTSSAPPISALQRRLALTNLVMAWSRSMRGDDGTIEGAIAVNAAAGRETPAQAANLAAELANLIDMVETENASLDDIAKLVPDQYSDHWQHTIGFLRIVTQFWPAYLDEHGLASPMASRNEAIIREARRLAGAPPRDPVIVAGVTGSIPATAELMRAVADLPNGAIVLPNLDMTLDARSWERIGPRARGERGQSGHSSHHGHPEHPQFALKTLLDRLGINRSDVAMLGEDDADARSTARLTFISEAMRPASTTAEWHTFAQTVDRERLRNGLEGVHLIDAPSAHDEAEAVALILREALETPGQTAALVSPDRLLARRVATRLETWGIRVDDSAGRPFAKTVPGTFLDLVIEAAHSRFAPAPLTALLKHPLTRLGLGAFEARRAARAIEIAAFRTDYLGTGLDGVDAAVEEARQDVTDRERRERAVRRLRDGDWDGARDLVRRLRSAFAPLVALYEDRNAHKLSEMAAAHVAAAEALALLPAEPATVATGPAPADSKETLGGKGEETSTEAIEPPSPLYLNEAGTAAANLFAGLVDAAMPPLTITANDYADLYRSLIANENVRLNVPLHPRLAIWGPFEARLQQPDIVVLGSLNDGKWPESADPGPWLNRPMRAELGLPAPEEQIGHAAHDFTSLLGAKRVYLTRAEKVDGVPTVPSRWLMRIVALLDGLGMRDAIAMDRPWLGWARARDHVGERITIRPPAPVPPVAMRPRRISVSGVEQWLANPYAIYARHILGLDPLPALGNGPDNSLKGSIIHDVLAEFARRHPESLPEDTASELVAIAKHKLAPYLGHPRIRAFWLPRFERFAQWFAETEPARRQGTLSVAAEIKGALLLAAPAGDFMLTARADRLDLTADGIAITDYKTGQVPSDRRVLAGSAPQLPLEAAIAIGGGFDGIGPKDVVRLTYIRSTGGFPPGEDHSPKIGDVRKVAATQRADLERLIAKFDEPETPYPALRRPTFDYAYDDFAHLARVAEWSGQSETQDED
ncbi:MAG: double-strand break repair protein AddB [Hyphomicrobiaceae bacterium]|nr:double-strand break repair protein AddB [Hyphomicrobiaceae bacterium]